MTWIPIRALKVGQFVENDENVAHLRHGDVGDLVPIDQGYGEQERTKCMCRGEARMQCRPSSGKRKRESGFGEVREHAVVMHKDER